MRFKSSLLHAVDRSYSLLVKSGGNLQSLFLLYMRLTWGYQFFITGWGKLHAIEWTTQYFASLHIGHPYFNAYFVGWVEFIGGICLFFGFASRLASIPLTILLLTALSTAHRGEISHFLFLTEPLSLVKQTPYPFLITCLLVFCFGPGRLSIDAWLKRWSEKRPKY